MISKFRDRLDNKFVRSMMKFEVLWKGDTLSCIHNFNSFNCHLCMAEKMEILKANFSERSRTINKCEEIFGTCRHNSKFHTLQEISPTIYRLQFDEDSDELSDDTDEDTEKNVDV